MRYDVAIVGGGPAGATLARLIGDKLKTVIIDLKDDTSSNFHKVCGGLLSSDAQKSLSYYGLTLPKSVLVDPQIFSVKTMDLVTEQVREYQRFYMNLDRAKFDQWLLSLLPKSVDKIIGRVVDVVGHKGDYRVEYIDNETDEKTKIEANIVVGAEGANSIVRKKVFKGAKMSHYTAIQQWFSSTQSYAHYACIFDKETSDCCSWIISKDEHLIFGGAFGVKDSRENFEKQKKRLEIMGYDLENPTRTEACMVLRPKSVSEVKIHKNGVYLIGEAAGFISPSSLEGFSWAMDSARYLSEALLSDKENPEKIYWRKTLKLKWKLQKKILKVPFMYWPWLRKLVMASKLTSIK
ncbi:MAG: FAD-binding protein [Tissierellia bacterium]|nr:FAD-binding protein [Tissierellia bacterium]